MTEQLSRMNIYVIFFSWGSNLVKLEPSNLFLKYTRPLKVPMAIYVPVRLEQTAVIISSLSWLFITKSYLRVKGSRAFLFSS
jgi:hypothetical protein